MKMKTLAKTQIGIGIGIFVIVLIANIVLYNLVLESAKTRSNDLTEFHRNIYAQHNMTKTEQAKATLSVVNSIYNLLGFYALFATIVIAADVIILILLTMMILDGIAMLTKD